MSDQINQNEQPVNDLSLGSLEVSTDSSELCEDELENVAGGMRGAPPLTLKQAQEIAAKNRAAGFSGMTSVSVGANGSIIIW